MERSIKTEAVVVKTARYGELHKIVTLLSPSLGVISAIVYGGRKGKRTALAPLLSIGTFQLYNNPVKKEYSIEEGLLSFIPENITNDLESTYVASLLCEIVTKTPSDEPQPLYDLLKNALIALENSKAYAKKIVIAFIWKIIQLSGLAPDLEYCPSCDRKYEENEVLTFSSSILSPVCKNCGDEEDFSLPPGARRYLRYTMKMTFNEAVSVNLNPPAEMRILSYMTKWIKLHVNTPLKTLENWQSFL